MNKANTQSLIKDFPHLYRQAREEVQSSMHYGFACGDGWFQVLYELSAKIAARAAVHGIDQDDDRYPRVDQVKEKFGVLRFYTTGYSDYKDLIEEAVAKTRETCEVCGQPGAMRTQNWIKVSCDRCDARSNAIHAQRTEEWAAQERTGGYRKIINDAFAQVDAKKTESSELAEFDEDDAAVPELSDDQLTRVCDASKALNAGVVGKRVSVIDELNKKDCLIKKKYLFLDFDGVLHPSEVYQDPVTEHIFLEEQFEDDGHYLFEHVPLFLQILDEVDRPVEIILSTSWVRVLKGIEHAKAYLPEELQRRISGAIWHPEIQRHHYPQHRFGQILIYCEQNNISKEDWIAIDDDAIRWDEDYKENLVQTDGYVGLGSKKILDELKDKLIGKR
jgi:hypothetical protein